MTVPDVDPDRVILLLGEPRSGTTWLAKIFDSHPDVLYRHEPDTVLRDRQLQDFFDAEAIPRLRRAAAAYLARLLETRTLKASGSLPVFRKRYHAPPARLLRTGMIYGLRAAEKLTGGASLIRGLAIPDMVDPRRHPALRIVMKSVSSQGRARLFAEALPGCRIIHIVRDPCGQVASVRRGTALGKLASGAAPEAVADTPQARRYGLNAELLARMSDVERLAWNWVIMNERVIEDLAGLSRAKVVRYQDLCTDPIGVSKALFDFAGLAWDAQTETFLERSTRSNAADRYYQVFKNTATARDRWKRELSGEERRRILGVVRQTGMSAFCPESCL